MIVSMKKVSIVVLSRERKEALRHLKKVGVMHLESLEGSGETLSGYKEEASSAFSAAAILEEIKNPKKVTKVSNLSDSELSKKCAMVIELSERKKKLLEEIASYSAELERLSAWGEGDPDDFSYLDGKNISLRMFEIPEAKYDELSDELKTVLVNRFRKIARFLLIDAPSERPSSLPPEAFAVPLPGVSTKKIKEKIESSRREISSIEKTLSGETVYRPQIESLIKKLEKDIQFENVYSGMGKENCDKDTDLAWLTGFVPVDSIAAFKASCAENSWAYAVSDPSEDDEVPTKLKNNPLVSLIYPLTDFFGNCSGLSRIRYIGLVSFVLYCVLRNDFRGRRLRAFGVRAGTFHGFERRKKRRLSACGLGNLAWAFNGRVGDCNLHMVRANAGAASFMVERAFRSADFKRIFGCELASFLDKRSFKGNSYDGAESSDFLLHACVPSAFGCPFQGNCKEHRRKILEVDRRIRFSSSVVGNVLRCS